MTGPSEVAWFAALCDDDYAQLGVTDPALRSSMEHCAAIVETAEQHGFDAILLPSGYALGIDAVTFAAAVAQRTGTIRLLTAMRMGEMWAPQLARQVATLQHILDGRLLVNVISSDLPGESLDSAARYDRTLEHMTALRTLLSGQPLDPDTGPLHVALDPPRIAAEHGCPPLYFGGLSPDARNVAAQASDVYLMWPDTMDQVRATIDDMRARAEAYGRTLRFGYRVHVVVRETESDARAAAEHLVAALDPATGDAIRSRSLDSQSAGVRRQAALRDSAATDGYIEPNLWTGIGRGRSGCGAAIVGDPQQVADKLRAYEAMGISTFILSGYPHIDECRRFGQLVMPLLRSSA